MTRRRLLFYMLAMLVIGASFGLSLGLRLQRDLDAKVIRTQDQLIQEYEDLSTELMRSLGYRVRKPRSPLYV